MAITDNTQELKAHIKRLQAQAVASGAFLMLAVEAMSSECGDSNKELIIKINNFLTQIKE